MALGETYSYVIDRLWKVIRVNPDGSLIALGPKGKEHHLEADDPHIEKAGWLQRSRYRLRMHRLRTSRRKSRIG